MASFNDSSFSRSAGRWTYDVFLSFRGEDTRNNFVDHLYAALDQRGIITFKDDEKLRRGESIRPELQKAIEESRYAVVIFSKNYASSTWCLDELAKIMECWEQIGQKVLPVFYLVDPSDVRGQKGSYDSAFRQYTEKFLEEDGNVNKWRKALTAAANLSGYDLSKTANGHENECISKLVKEIWNDTKPHVLKNLIGMESRMQTLKSILSIRSQAVRIIGIWGMGGIGKTTIARAVFQEISAKFEASSFVKDVRENGSTIYGLMTLQKKILTEILMTHCIDVRDVDDGINKLRRTLCNKKVLIVLDDVNNVTQLESLAASHEWFGPGSRIIITTRDEHLLSDADEKYKPDLLLMDQALQLFSWHAFCQQECV